MVMGTGGVVTPFGVEKKTSTTADVYPVGSLIALGDGRIARRISAGEAITVGLLAMAPIAVADHDADLSILAAAAGAISVTVTPGSTVGAKNLYQGGKLYLNDEAEKGHTYQIKSHPEIASGTAFVIKLDEPLITAITAVTQVGLYASIHQAVEIWDYNDVDGPAVGVLPVDIADESYGWAISRGTQACFMDGTPPAGLPVIASDGVAGAVELWDNDATAAAPDWPIVGYQGAVIGVSGEYMPVELKID